MVEILNRLWITLAPTSEWLRGSVWTQKLVKFGGASTAMDLRVGPGEEGAQHWVAGHGCCLRRRQGRQYPHRAMTCPSKAKDLLVI